MYYHQHEHQLQMMVVPFRKSVLIMGNPWKRSRTMETELFYIFRASRTLTYNDEQFHILEKIKMQETIRALQDLLQKVLKSISFKIVACMHPTTFSNLNVFLRI